MAKKNPIHIIEVTERSSMKQQPWLLFISTVHFFGYFCGDVSTCLFPFTVYSGRMVYFFKRNEEENQTEKETSKCSVA